MFLCPYSVGRGVGPIAPVATYRYDSAEAANTWLAKALGMSTALDLLRAAPRPCSRLGSGCHRPRRPTASRRCRPAPCESGPAARPRGPSKDPPASSRPRPGSSRATSPTWGADPASLAVERQRQSVYSARSAENRPLSNSDSSYEVRTRHQPQDRQGPRPDDPALAPAAGGSGDRVIMSEGLTLAA
jgi:hypothetical protein